MSYVDKVNATKMVLVDLKPKAEVARAYATSPRSVGRWIDTVLADLQTLDYGDTTIEKLAEARGNKNKNSLVSITSDLNALYAFHYGNGVKEADFPETSEGVEPVPEVCTEFSDSDYKVVATRKSISITLLYNGKVVDTVAIDNKNELFEHIFDLILESGMSQESLAKAYRLASPATMIAELTDGQLTVNVKDGVITFNPEVGPSFPVSGLLSQRIITTIREKGVDGTRTLLNFMNRLMKNPSNRAVNETYGFLEHNDIELTDDGYFIAWKKVSANYMDIHSGTMNNSPGTEVRVSRNMVDEDSRNTCSHGLHVCAKSYLGSFGSTASNKVVRCKVDPADVCAVPADYNNAKMRTCGYIVIDDVTSKY